LGCERKRGRGYRAGHQGELQALSHYRAYTLIERRQTSPSHVTTRNPTENLNQSETIIGPGPGAGNQSEGRRTTEVISANS
jgi:hypothetical protein